MSRHTLYPNVPGELLSDLIRRAGLKFDLPCAGNHTCGKCRIKVSGDLSPVSHSEAAMLSDTDISKGFRMACFAKVFGMVEAEIPDVTGQQIVTSGTGCISADAPMMDEDCFGAAIDIGTTTVVCKVFDAKGHLVGIESELNSQQIFGADVISRINHGINHGNDVLHKKITAQLESMLAAIAVKNSIRRDRITDAVVTGNTTMLHFFAGLDPKGIGFVPFIPQSLFDDEHTDLLAGIRAYIPPCVSAYVGADLACCVLASDMTSKKETSLIIDIGTNGEMALFMDGSLHSCSTAAGPAFEGTGISHGMVAADGAITHVNYDRQTKELLVNTIGGAKAAGICGSGVVDTTAMLLDTQSLLQSGRICRDESLISEYIDENETKFKYPGTEVTFTQADIRQIQLAKAAISAGSGTLSDACSMTSDDLDVLYLCGGFGSFVDLAAAEKIGLLPAGSPEKTVVLGNGAVSGASMILLNTENRKKIREIVQKCHYIELSGNEIFMDNYIEAMSFGNREEE